ncbi:MAG: hypothetical protein M3297_02615 [Thermoproteota archaeon]|nr:hypothetical protein [Thermoproteota archaeon]
MVKWFESLLGEIHRFVPCIRTVFPLIGLLTICSIYFTDASAHEIFRFGNISVASGWEIEPPLDNQLNSVEVNITRAEADGNSVPVRNAFSELDASIKSGGLTKSLDFEPQEESAGLYRAAILPTQVGSYSLVLTGRIESQTIDSELGIEDVEDTAAIEFPLVGNQVPSGSSVQDMGSGQQVSSASQPNPSIAQLSPLLTDFARQVNSSGNTAIQAQMVATETRDKLEELGGSVDRAYVFGMVSIGVGISGIIIGAFALTRNDSRPGTLGRKKRIGWLKKKEK